MGRLVVVSNRVGPLKDTGRAGGLAVALVDALTQTGGLWFGWSGEVSEEGTFGQIKEQRTKAVQLAQIDITPADYEDYYAGYANRTLWPVLHYRLDLAVFDRRHETGYRQVNDRFATRLRPLIEADDVLWVHDYHFLTFAAALRAMEVGNPIGFFLHIPFPAPEILAALPNAGSIVRAMLAYDLIGFQTRRDAANFRRFVVEELGGTEVGDSRLSAGGRTVIVKAYPIGIDAEAFSKFAMSPEARRSVSRLEKQLAGRQQIIGVDRIDYSKGLPERFRAFERLLDDYPENRGRVSLMQIAPPSRSELDAYIEIRRTLEELTGHVNGRFSDIDWTPIRFLTRSFPRRVLAGIYRASRVGLVTPLRDGMNLVAKEYVAAQRAEDPGVLVLSRFAGAAEGMPEALVVNPHSAEEVAQGLQSAITMPLEERRDRWQAMFDRLCREDAHAWAQAILSDLRSVA
ncbi:alpha,alpha-trehalose-phosphate synthase (UDP-forming) [Polymorphum gilvum]|uniref:Glycosyl transferase, family 20 n=1 Tax=Polymorphum gilvum (strain LMG 25793 / CGMCC 1.9160 / SL003B-26A1) TaxID=991905 RepID=F2IVS8_POLGS|nr:trehalose-6-phosphate synthase [Polymorphum gilvum]ADZ69185.1 Glycosyl transferase, family 20 [Polymorphum gilvum SL003B-26A1]